MGLLDKLQALGCQLKLVQIVPKTKTAPRKISTRSVTLQELTTQLQAENVRILAESPVELKISFDKIFETAGILKASKEWNVENLVHLLQSKPYTEMDKTSLQRAIIEKLTAEGITAEELVKDAIAKDQALDAFETFVDKKMKSRFSARQMRLMEIEKDMNALRQEQIRLSLEDREETGQLNQWRQKKENYEKEILQAVDLVISCKELAVDKESSTASSAE